MNARSRKSHANQRRDLVESLEPRMLLSTVYALNASNQLLSFDSATPATITTPVTITGLQTSETIVGIDFRPTNGLLYGVGSTSRVYTIDTATGAATQVGTGTFTPALSGTDFGVDFNPVSDRIRVVSDTDQNLRLNPDTGAVANTDTNLTYAVGDPNAAANPNVISVAYSNNIPNAPSTVFYGIDSNLDIENNTANPNAGQLSTSGALGVNTTPDAGFDIDPAGNAFASLTAPAATTSNFYTVNIATGAATLVGAIGGSAVITDIALPVSSGTFALSAPTYSVTEAGPVATITITRTSGSVGPASVTLATSDGTATAGQDYTAVNQVVNFADGDTTKTVDIPITDDNQAEADETVNVTLSAPTNNTTLGTQKTAVLTITDNDGPPSIQFSAPTYTVNESGTNAVITVNRSGDTSGASSVTFATSNGTATAGSDYTATNTTVDFADGETQKTVNVPIINDTTDEPDETVTLALSAPNNASLGSQAVSTLTITDDDPGVTQAPDSTNAKRNVITVTGTAGDDNIRIIKRGGTNLEVLINGTTQGVFSKVTRVIVLAGDGNDVVRMNAGILQSGELHGGNGNDVLLGAAGRDLLIGGQGIDVLLGRGNDDILIGGTTSLDNNETALANIMAVWLGRGNATKRADVIRTGTGVTGGFAFNNTTITDDTALDVMAGDQGSDVIYNSALDVLTDDDAKDIPVSI